MPHRQHLSALEKTFAVGSWALAGAIFLTVGWLAMVPDDPLGAVSLLTRRHAGFMLLQAAALAGIAATAATILAGRFLVDVGSFAASLGLGAVSLRGDTAGYLLRNFADGSTMSQRGLALRLALESMAWFGVIALTVFVSTLVMYWCFPGSESMRGRSDGSDSDENSSAGKASATTEERASARWQRVRHAGADIPWIGRSLVGPLAADATPPGDGLRHTLVAAGIGLVAINLFSTGLSTRAIEHGQACFIIVAAVCLGCFFAQRFAPVHSAAWSLLAIPLITVAAYFWAAAWAGTGDASPGLPSSCYLRILPLQYIAVGAASAVGMFWYLHSPPLDPEMPSHRAVDAASLSGRM